jgi:hypothetical protein
VRKKCENGVFIDSLKDIATTLWVFFPLLFLPSHLLSVLFCFALLSNQQQIKERAEEGEGWSS